MMILFDIVSLFTINWISPCGTTLNISVVRPPDGGYQAVDNRRWIADGDQRLVDSEGKCQKAYDRMFNQPNLSHIDCLMKTGGKFHPIAYVLTDTILTKKHLKVFKYWEITFLKLN